MKEWSELEERYQEMRQRDRQAAEEFKRKMTGRFQKTVEALEEEGLAEKRQLTSMHQQRVMSIINQRKKAAMECYTHALDSSPAPKLKHVEKCMEKLFRALEKDRSHTLHHYRHLLQTNVKQALREKGAIADHLENLIRMGNQSLAMLERIPSGHVQERLRDRMIAFWHHLRGAPLSAQLSRDAEVDLMDHYEEEVAQRAQEREQEKLAEEERRAKLEDEAEPSKVDQSMKPVKESVHADQHTEVKVQTPKIKEVSKSQAIDHSDLHLHEHENEISAADEDLASKKMSKSRRASGDHPASGAAGASKQAPFHHSEVVSQSNLR